MAAAKAEAAAKAAEEEKMEQEAAWAAGSEPQPATFSHHTDIRSSARRLERPSRCRIPSGRARGICRHSCHRSAPPCDARAHPCGRRRQSRRTARAPRLGAGWSYPYAHRRAWRDRSFESRRRASARRRAPAGHRPPQQGKSIQCHWRRDYTAERRARRPRFLARCSRPSAPTGRRQPTLQLFLLCLPRRKYRRRSQLPRHPPQLRPFWSHPPVQY